MKKIAAILITVLLLANATAQIEDGGYIKELNPEFIKAIANNDTNGYLPPSVAYDFDTRTALRSSMVLPTSFDMRTTGLLTAPRNQLSTNTCWSFSVLYAIQANWAKMGFASADYSAENLANCHGFDKTKAQGGNADLAIAYLARVAGPVYESADPFVNTATGTCKTVTLANKPAFVTQAFNIPKDVNIIKQMVYRYGAVMTGMSANSFTNNFNATTKAMYAKDGTNGSINHAACIVGWDDDFVVTIPSGINPTKKGAWIIKNTWGTGTHDGGYYYASYEDYFVGQYAAVFAKRAETASIDTVYNYDKLGQITTFTHATLKDSVYSLVQYTAPQTQHISKVGTFTSIASTVIDVRIYTTKTGDVLTGQITESLGNICEFPGYHTIDISANVNGAFYVEVTYRTPNHALEFPIEKAVAGYASPTIETSGKQWFRATAASSWVEAGSATGFDLCVKVYAKNTTKQLQFTPAKKTACINNTINISNNSVGTYNSFEWNFGAGASPATATTATVGQTTNVTYSTAGLKKIMLIGITGAVRDTFTVGSAIEVTDGVPLAIVSDLTVDSVLKNKQLIEINASGADSYLWESSTYITDLTKSRFSFYADKTTTFRLTANLGTCTATDSITIKVYNCAAYDDIADAKTLSFDVTEGPFSNVCATRETNEAYPTTTASCTSQTDWCSGEARIDNSLWFKFTAPSTGKVTIKTTGIDNQIALYDATATGTYNDMISGNPANYTILAANDDESGTVFSALIDTVYGLTPGKTYWLQLDGSAGGAEGDNYITLTSSTVGTESVIANKAKLLNPSVNGNIIITNAAELTGVSVWDLQGHLLLSTNTEGENIISINASQLSAGNYLVKMDSHKQSWSEIIIVK